MESIVALDIETTGLDPENDAIIEIGAVRFNGRRGEDKSTLVQPDVASLPSSPTDRHHRPDGTQPPPIHDVLDDLEHFVGQAPVLGHNISFDLAFLSRYGLRQQPIPGRLRDGGRAAAQCRAYNLGR